MDELTDEELRQEYNAAVANGLLIKARRIERQIQAREWRERANRQLT